jgi:hypothetical protein
MIKIHKLEDGDIIKILPMIDENDNISWIRPYDCVSTQSVGLGGLTGRSLIADISEKRYLRRISDKLKYVNSIKKLPFITRYGMNIYIDGEIRILNVGMTLYKMIVDNPKLLDIRGNHQIFVVKKEVSAGGQVFPDWKSSYVSEKSWTLPVSDINSKEEWYSYIKLNQPDFEGYLRLNDIFKHKQSLIDYLGKDMLGDLISDDRQIKLEKIGI